MPLSEAERASAVAVLRVALADSADAVRAAIAKDPESWHILLHMTFGLAVRNRLREHGVRDEGIELDDIWPRLVEEAVRGPR